MLAKTLSFALLGMEAYPVEIEVDVSPGLPVFTLVGMADTAIKESKERVRSAVKNSGFEWPQDRVTVNLAPSDIKKEGSAFDLAIALGILAATSQLDSQRLSLFCILGELSLDGSLRPVRGALPIALSLEKSRLKNLLISSLNAREAAIVPEVSVWPLKTLRQAVEFLSNPALIPPFKPLKEECFQNNRTYNVDFSEVKGQYFAKRALEVAVAGGHNLAMIGPPGSGKSMLAKRIPTIMPELSWQEALEITKIHSVAGTLSGKEGMMTCRPFRSPHHTISHVALVGGGSLPLPGEISLAHQGVLFLDEFPEFYRNSLEALRQPLEDGSIRISRARKSLTFPASFMLVCAMNPCPCGYLGSPQKACRCNTTKIANYIGKISGPLLDRIDIHLEVPAIKYKELAGTEDAEASAAIKARVQEARRIQSERFREDGIFSNSQMHQKLTKKYCALGTESKELLKMAMTELGLSARAYDKILKVARTIADLAGKENILAEHISEAIQYRSLDKHL